MRLDARSSFPSGMENYLQFYGWHFSKKMEEWAASQMIKGSQKITPYSLEDLQSLLNRTGVQLNKMDYDAVYVANMAKADFLNSSIDDETHLALFVKDYCGDVDGYDGMIFTRFYADCIGKGNPINWEDMI